MVKTKQIKKQIAISPERLVELRRVTLIASTGSLLRLSDSKVTNEQVSLFLVYSLQFAYNSIYIAVVEPPYGFKLPDIAAVLRT